MFKGRKLYVSFACAYYFDRGKTMLPGVVVIHGQFIMFVKGAEVEVGEIKSLSSTPTENNKVAKMGKTMRRLVRNGDENFKNIGFKCISPFPFWKVSPSCVEGCLFWGESYVQVQTRLVKNKLPITMYLAAPFLPCTGISY